MFLIFLIFFFNFSSILAYIAGLYNWSSLKPQKTGCCFKVGLFKHYMFVSIDIDQKNNIPSSDTREESGKTS